MNRGSANCEQIRRNLEEAPSDAALPPAVLEHLLACEACADLLAVAGDGPGAGGVLMLGARRAHWLRLFLAGLLVVLAPLAAAITRNGEADGVPEPRETELFIAQYPQDLEEFTRAVHLVRQVPAGENVLDAWGSRGSEDTPRLKPATVAKLSDREVALRVLGNIDVSWDLLLSNSRDQADPLLAALVRGLGQAPDPAAWMLAAMAISRVSWPTDTVARKGVLQWLAQTSRNEPWKKLSRPFWRYVAESYGHVVLPRAPVSAARCLTALEFYRGDGRRSWYPRFPVCDVLRREMGNPRRFGSPTAMLVQHHLLHVWEGRGLVGLAGALLEFHPSSFWVMLKIHHLAIFMPGLVMGLLLWLCLVGLHHRPSVVAAGTADPVARRSALLGWGTLGLTLGLTMAAASGNLLWDWISVGFSQGWTRDSFRSLLEQHLFSWMDPRVSRWREPGIELRNTLSLAVLLVFIAFTAVRLVAHLGRRWLGVQVGSAGVLVPAFCTLFFLGVQYQPGSTCFAYVCIGGVCLLLGRLNERLPGLSSPPLLMAVCTGIVTLLCGALYTSILDVIQSPRLAEAWAGMVVRSIPVIVLPALAGFVAAHIGPGREVLRRRMLLVGATAPFLLVVPWVAAGSEIWYRSAAVAPVSRWIEPLSTLVMSLVVLLLCGRVASVWGSLLAADGAAAYVVPPARRLSEIPVVRGLVAGHLVPVLAMIALSGVLGTLTLILLIG
jgi:hypothetical protein